MTAPIHLPAPTTPSEPLYQLVEPLYQLALDALHTPPQPGRLPPRWQAAVSNHDILTTTGVAICWAEVVRQTRGPDRLLTWNLPLVADPVGRPDLIDEATQAAIQFILAHCGHQYDDLTLLTVTALGLRDQDFSTRFLAALHQMAVAAYQQHALTTPASSRRRTRHRHHRNQQA